MACGERIEQETRSWGWCRKWGIPYPCRKVTIKTRYQYVFTATRYVPSIFPFWQKRQGCCEGTAYEWKKYVFWNSPKPYNWTNHEPGVVLTFSSKLGSKGPCIDQADGLG